MNPQSESEEGGEDIELDRSTDAEEDQDRIEDDLLEAHGEDAVADDGTDGDEDSASDDSEESGEDGEGEEDSDQALSHDLALEDVDLRPSAHAGSDKETSSQREQHSSKSPESPACGRSLSPAGKRKRALLQPSQVSCRTYQIEAICALPHPVPTHALSASFCMTHLLTGSDDGYIRDYDIFSAVNGKMFLTAQQRHHCNVVEGIMKAGQLRFWWENPGLPHGMDGSLDEPTLAPVYSMITHSDALWTLAGSNAGNINLFTLRHEPGRLHHVMNGHRGPVSALAMQHDEKGFFSAGWDGEALQWDLNTGQIVRHFTAHGAQLTCIALKPMTSGYRASPNPVVHALPVTQHDAKQILRTQTLMTETNQGYVPGQSPDTKMTPATSEAIAASGPSMPTKTQQDMDAKSDISFDPLFDEDAEAAPSPVSPSGPLAVNTHLQPKTSSPSIPTAIPPTPSAQHSRSLVPPKNAPPLLDPHAYSTFSPDILMTASIDGQVVLWDKRVSSSGGPSGRGGGGVGRLWMSEKTPPWCLSACWSADGGQIYAGRRNGTVDVWDVRQLGISGPTGTPRMLKTLRNPISSGVVSCVVAFPDGQHIACASADNIRLWNAAETGQHDSSAKMKGGVQFKIIPGHHGGYVSQMLVDPAARFLVSASSNRGWHGDSTRTVFVHDVKHIR